MVVGYCVLAVTFVLLALRVARNCHVRFPRLEGVGCGRLVSSHLVSRLSSASDRVFLLDGLIITWVRVARSTCTQPRSAYLSIYPRVNDPRPRFLGEKWAP